MSPFTGSGLQEIKIRSHGKSELSGRTDRPLHCSHFNHRRDLTYNKAERGIRCTVVEHASFHLYFKDNPTLIGLAPCRNAFAIDMLNRDCVAFMSLIGKLDELEHELEESTEMWVQLFAKAR